MGAQNPFCDDWEAFWREKVFIQNRDRRNTSSIIPNQDKKRSRGAFMNKLCAIRQINKWRQKL